MGIWYICNMEQTLEKYFLEVIGDSRAFLEIPQDERAAIAQTAGFAFYQLSTEMRKFGGSLKEVFFPKA